MQTPDSGTSHPFEELGGGSLQNDSMPNGTSRGPADVELEIRSLSLVRNEQCLAYVPGTPPLELS